VLSGNLRVNKTIVKYGLMAIRPMLPNRGIFNSSTACSSFKAIIVPIRRQTSRQCADNEKRVVHVQPRVPALGLRAILIKPPCPVNSGLRTSCKRVRNRNFNRNEVISANSRLFSGAPRSVENQ